MIPQGIGMLLDQVFSTKERVDKRDLTMAAQGATVPQSWLALFEQLPEREFSHGEALSALDRLEKSEGASESVP